MSDKTVETDHEADQPADVSTGIFKIRRHFLTAAVTSTHQRFKATHEGVTYYGLAKTEHQFRLALCREAFPDIKKLNAKELHAEIASELMSGEQKVF